jgi:hypothetical protein
VRPHEIETARLRLRPLAKADVDELHALWSSHEVRRHLWDNEIITRQWTVSLVAESLSLFTAHGTACGMQGFTNERSSSASEAIGISTHHRS